VFPFVFANHSTMQIANKNALSWGDFFQKYLEISKIILFFIFVAI